VNLQPLYDVKERLEYAAIAGTGLLSEDFRLQRAAEGLKPLAAASRVFAQVDQGLQALLSASAEKRAGLLLDVLALADAVLYTQGKTGAAGELEPLPNLGCGRYCSASYNQLAPILQAINGTGGGRMNQIEQAWQDHPEFFADYRVLPALVKGLGESYAELADLYCEILKAQGPAILPLLKQGFDPAGKRDMARRVQAIESLAGPAENDWYLSQLEQAKKPVRGALIFALRHCPENLEQLIALTKTEKGEHKDMACRALARMDGDGALDYWRKLAEKSEDKALEYMQGAQSAVACQITAELWEKALEHYRPIAQQPQGQPLTAEDLGRLQRLLDALEDKSSPEIWDVYQKIAQLGLGLDRVMETNEKGKKNRTLMAFNVADYYVNTRSTRPFSEAAPLCLARSIRANPRQELCQLADRLNQLFGGPWAVPALMAALMTLDSKEAYDRAEQILGSGGQKRPDSRFLLQDVLWGLIWDRSQDAFQFFNVYRRDPISEKVVYATIPIRAALDSRWYGLLIQVGELDSNLMNLLRPMEPEIKQQVGEYCYRRITTRGGLDPRAYVDALLQCDWKDWDNFMVKCVQSSGQVWFRNAMVVLEQLPISYQNRADQLEAIIELIKSKKVKAQYGTWPEAAAKQTVANWRRYAQEGK